MASTIQIRVDDDLKKNCYNPFIKKYKCKGTNSVEEARELAVQMFRELVGTYAVGKKLEPIVSLNWFCRTDM